SGLVDELIGFTAGLALGAEGRPSIGPLELAHLAEAPRFALIETRPLGHDLLHVWSRG
ncbi:riboflavin biosynthesis protein RibD, partial [Rhodovulum sulfidophilum]|nr:riboflavin biosynthesis protein RibD [Rhodovulum sulfidophilum]